MANGIKELGDEGREEGTLNGKRCDAGGTEEV
jgi:hypothetical protein